MAHNNVKDIRNSGQSIWLDFFDREIMNSGKLETLIDQDGVSGVTSNPSIFEKAIHSSPDYDEDIKTLSREKNNSEDIFMGLAIKDIRRATDLFRPAYEKSNGKDGFVSLEVSPRLAFDTKGTIKQAKQLWQAVDRKNVMIKIPGTAEGLPAIRKCTSEGININITLLFGLSRYQQVADAYISGLEDRVNAGQPIDKIVSVASFFLSRIDVMIDPMLEQKKLNKLKGEVGIALAKTAYQAYKSVFTSERFKKLEGAGARKQHLLWASTSAKDPSFRDVKYVEALIGAETIDTIPLETLEAFRDHGEAKNRLEDNAGKATEVLAQLDENGIDINSITQKLEEEGIEKFKTSYDKLLKEIEEKKMKIFA